MGIVMGRCRVVPKRFCFSIAAGGRGVHRSRFNALSRGVHCRAHWADRVQLDSDRIELAGGLQKRAFLDGGLDKRGIKYWRARVEEYLGQLEMIVVRLSSKRLPGADPGFPASDPPLYFGIFQSDFNVVGAPGLEPGTR
jgi:hypothetical protein